MFMIRQTTIIVTTLFLLSCDNGPPESNGFRGVRWGTHITKMQRSEFVDHSKGISLYTPDRWNVEWSDTNDIEVPEFLSIEANVIDELGGVNLTCVLGFFNGRFWSVYMRDIESEERFFEVLNKVYGKPSKLEFVQDTTVLNEYSITIEKKYDVYIWEDGDTRRDFRINVGQRDLASLQEFSQQEPIFMMYSKLIKSEVDKVLAIERMNDTERDSVNLENAPADF